MNSILRQRSIKSDLVNEESLTLKCIQVIFRHGARTPLKHLPGIEEVDYDAKILEPIDYMRFQSTTVAMDGSPVSSFPIEDNFKGIYFKGGALAGQLTNVGRKQCFKMGLCLGEKYRKLFKDAFDPSLVWMRSSPLIRCIESLKSFLAGIYSGDLTSLNNLPIKVDILNTKMYPIIFDCPWYKEALTYLHKEMIKDLTYSSLVAQIGKNYSVMMESPVVDIALIHDHMRTRKVHGLYIPEKLEQFLPEIEKIATKQLYMNSGGMYNQITNGLKLSMGRLVNTLAKNFEAIVNGKTLDDLKPPSVFLFSGHDSTVAPILEILGYPIKEFPDFAANIVLELYEDNDKNHWVQVLYNGKPLILRHCCQTIVSLDDFLNVVGPYRIDYEEFLNLCHSSRP